MVSDRSARIAASFGARAGEYDRHAKLQDLVAARLASRLPRLERPRVLELACGTGLFSRHLLDAYPDGDFLFTDLAPEMVAETKRRLSEAAGGRARFAVQDASDPAGLGRFDLIATSMSLHWLREPEAALHIARSHLEPGGMLVYAGLGPASFAEWRQALAAEDARSGLVSLAALPGAKFEESIVMEEGGLAFLRSLRAIGGLTARDGYEPLKPGTLRRVLRRLDREHGGCITWQIVYGHLSPIETSPEASRSSPSMMPL